MHACMHACMHAVVVAVVVVVVNIFIPSGSSHAGMFPDILTGGRLSSTISTIQFDP
jgi:uncharacterized ion transporter superfamily protein YfcC